MSNKILIFDLWGELAHFRKIYTTSSPLSYSFPPRTTIIGMVAAIMGFPRDTYYDIFDPKKCNIGIRIINQIDKGKFNTNLLNTKKSRLRISNDTDARTQVGYEIVKSPRYRIYFGHVDDELFNKLTKQIKEHKSVYTLSLGLANCLANFKYVAESEISNEQKLIEIHSVARLDKISKIQEYKEYFKVRMPRDFNSDRTVSEYAEYIFEKEGNTIKAISKGHTIKKTGESIVFL